MGEVRGGNCPLSTPPSSAPGCIHKGSKSRPLTSATRAPSTQANLHCLYIYIYILIYILRVTDLNLNILCVKLMNLNIVQTYATQMLLLECYLYCRKSVGRLCWRVAKECVRILKVNQKPGGVNERSFRSKRGFLYDTQWTGDKAGYYSTAKAPTFCMEFTKSVLYQCELCTGIY